VDDGEVVPCRAAGSPGAHASHPSAPARRPGVPGLDRRRPRIAHQETAAQCGLAAPAGGRVRRRTAAGDAPADDQRRRSGHAREGGLHRAERCHPLGRSGRREPDRPGGRRGARGDPLERRPGRSCPLAAERPGPGPPGPMAVLEPGGHSRRPDPLGRDGRRGGAAGPAVPGRHGPARRCAGRRPAAAAMPGQRSGPASGRARRRDRRVAPGDPIASPPGPGGLPAGAHRERASGGGQGGPSIRLPRAEDRDRVRRALAWRAEGLPERPRPAEPARGRGLDRPARDGRRHAAPRTSRRSRASPTRPATSAWP
jgi:hypothetical protein